MHFGAAVHCAYLDVCDPSRTTMLVVLLVEYTCLLCELEELQFSILTPNDCAMPHFGVKTEWKKNRKTECIYQELEKDKKKKNKKN